MSYRDRHLYRITDERKIGGVAAGLADYLGVSVVLVRIGFVISLLIGFGLPLYILFWLLTPRDPAEGRSRFNFLRILFYCVAAVAFLVGSAIIMDVTGEPEMFLLFLFGLGIGMVFLLRGKEFGKERSGAREGKRFIERDDLDSDESEARIAGVCARVGESTGIDPVIVRVVTVILIPITFPLVPILYAIAALVLPKSRRVLSR